MRTKKEADEKEEELVKEESDEKKEFRRIIELYKAQYPAKWVEYKEAELTAKLEKMV